MPNEISHNGSLYPTQMYELEQIAKTIRLNSFDSPADGLMPREDSMCIYYSSFFFLNGTRSVQILISVVAEPHKFHQHIVAY